jgi:hypothetical protein
MWVECLPRAITPTVSTLAQQLPKRLSILVQLELRLDRGEGVCGWYIEQELITFLLVLDTSHAELSAERSGFVVAAMVVRVVDRELGIAPFDATIPPLFVGL